MPRVRERAEKEKRRHPRFPMGMVLDLHAKGSPVSRGLVGTIVDMSVGGMLFETTAQLEEGATLYLKVNIPLEIRGEVRHMRKLGERHRYGVHFHKIDFGGQERARPKSFIFARFKRPK